MPQQLIVTADAREGCFGQPGSACWVRSFAMQLLDVRPVVVYVLVTFSTESETSVLIL
jgi:hypothetical protein